MALRQQSSVSLRPRGRFGVVAGRVVALLSVFAMLFSLLAACGGDDADPTPMPLAPTPTVAAAAQPAAADLAGVKDYALAKAAKMKQGTSDLAKLGATYYDKLAAVHFDYQAAYDADPDAMRAMLGDIKATWLVASTSYEENEGIVAGVPTLAYYDVWIDAGPPGADDPAGALDWRLTLPNGEVLDKPGNFMTHLTEPAIWGTVDAFVGLRVDLDGDGALELGEVLPEANRFKASTEGLDTATGEMTQAIQSWDPTMQDVFTALVVMIPTMSGYFEQWKLSVFVAGSETAQETAFVAVSRLLDISGILGGLDLAYDQISPAVAAANAGLDAQIQQGMTDLVGYVRDLYSQEQAGTHFTAEQADVFGSEAQNRASTLAGQITQSAALLNIEIAE